VHPAIRGRFVDRGAWRDAGEVSPGLGVAGRGGAVPALGAGGLGARRSASRWRSGTKHLASAGARPDCPPEAANGEPKDTAVDAHANGQQRCTASHLHPGRLPPAPHERPEVLWSEWRPAPRSPRLRFGSLASTTVPPSKASWGVSATVRPGKLRDAEVNASQHRRPVAPSVPPAVVNHQDGYRIPHPGPSIPHPSMSFAC
jgi:hypothetical protein